MWKKVYKDYKPDKPWQTTQVEPGKGITGCEMHETNGWQEAQHLFRPRKPGLLHTLRDLLFRRAR